ncbi:MAG: Crp/Fnr family transcriptional regulator [Saprospiraceae bacterium]
MTEIEKKLNLIFPHLNDSKLISELATIGKIIKIPRGAIILDEGQYIEYVPLMISGIVKVKRKNEENKIVFLYYLKSGESCAMTLSSCLKRQKSKVIANVLEDASVLLIPSNKIFFFMKNYANWSEFVLNTFQDKFNDAISAVERLAFMSLEEQIIDVIKCTVKVYNSNTIHTTHQTIADDLSTSRVIISRIVKKLEKEGVLTLGYKSITLN